MTFRKDANCVLAFFWSPVARLDSDWFRYKTVQHVDVKTTQIYARANLEMKRRALEKVADAPLPTMPSWQQNKTLLDWLHSL